MLHALDSFIMYIYRYIHTHTTYWMYMYTHMYTYISNKLLYLHIYSTYHFHCPHDELQFQSLPYHHHLL